MIRTAFVAVRLWWAARRPWTCTLPDPRRLPVRHPRMGHVRPADARPRPPGRKGCAMIVDLFAGPGGWDEGLRMLGRTDVLGIEWEPNACATAEAAGHRRLQADTLADRMAAGDDSLNWCEWEDPRSSLVCQRCKLRGGTHYYLTEGRLQMHLAAHRTAGHDVPVVEL